MSATASTSTAATAAPRGNGTARFQHFARTRRVLEQSNRDMRAALGTQHETATVRQIDIALIGDLKAGKSTLGNVLLRQLVFPTAFGPCTARATIVSATEDGQPEPKREGGDKEYRRYTLVGADGTRTERWDWPVNAELPPESITTRPGDALKDAPKDAPPAALAMVTTVDKDDPIASVEVSIHGSPLLGNGVRLLDLPGVNETDEMDEKVAKYFGSIAVVVFAMDAGPGLTNSGAKTLLEIKAKSAGIPFLFAANKIDQWKKKWGTTEEQVEQKKAEALATLYQKLRTHHAALRPCQDWSASPFFAAVSAQNAGDQYGASESLPPEFVAFEDKLFDLLEGRFNWVISESMEAMKNSINSWALH
jgi:small GTP-binding protein